jgi:hypothetical protein
MIEYESKIANQYRYLPNFNINNSQFYSINFNIGPKIVLQKTILVITNSNH